MKQIKHLLFLSILCSLVLFTNCGDSDDPVADTPTNTTDDSTDDDSTTVLDADGDGVADADDTCADTPSGETVDSSGCSDSQKDSDGDGVTDDLDTCADTADSTTVDADGCAVIIDSDLIYLDENGVTIKATEDAVIGEIYGFNGQLYVIADNEIFRYRQKSNVDYYDTDLFLITTYVTDMSFIGEQVWNRLELSLINEELSSWDVSSVTNMNNMFYAVSQYTADLSAWNVSNVTDMG